MNPGSQLLQAAIDYSQAIDRWNAATTDWESSGAYAQVLKSRELLSDAALVYARPRV